ncbi:DUF1700 domain-containing protein [Streptococcus ruminantium]|uniref:DUF1700 domain-containing protein n=1 Tax=Streptococcus ruminantium TaxID=1917441 RepID=UPI0012DC75B2|nr:hypothetical protein [Streptococcus ruminantium]
MTRSEYMAQLEKYLKKLPHKEFQEAITFFNEYFDEAGPEKESAIIEELGSPKEAASELINNMLSRHIEGETKDGDKLMDSTKPNNHPIYVFVALAFTFLLSWFFLSSGSVLGIFGIFIGAICGAFYLGKNLQEFRAVKKTVWLAFLAILSLPIAIPATLLLGGALIFLIFLVLGFLIGGLALGIGLFIGGSYLIWEGFSLLSQDFNVFLMGLGSGLSLIGGSILLYILTGFFAYWSWWLVKACFKWILKRGKRA